MSCDELDGVIAFDNVMDRLLDAEVRARSAALEVRSAEANLRVAQNDLDRIRKERDDLKAAIERDKPKLRRFADEHRRDPSSISRSHA